MHSEHFIPGKDASLEASIARMQTQLARAGFRLEEHLWQNSIENVWSVLLRDADCPQLFSNGKGSSKLAAQASALGEFLERLSTNHFWSQAYVGRENASAAFTHDPREKWFPLTTNAKKGNWPTGLLSPELRKFYNPNNTIPAEKLVDFNSGNAERGIVALPLTRLSDAKEVWFPVNILNNLYVSNGMSAGNSPFEARVQALSEIIERAVKFKVIREGICLPDVPENQLSRYPNILAGILRLQEAGFAILVKDASLGGVFPVLAIVLINPKDQGCFVSFGAHPSFEIALERALTELLQGRPLEALSGFPPPSFELDDVDSDTNVEAHFIDSSGEISWDFLANTPDYSFVDWDFSSVNSSTEADYLWLVDCIYTQKHAIYCIEFTHLGVYSCRIIVPGFSEIYPVDDLDYDNNGAGIFLREAILTLENATPEHGEILLNWLNDSELSDALLVSTVIGLAPDTGSIWEELRLGELRIWLALIAKNTEDVLEACEWIDHFGQILSERLRIYRCIETLINLDDTYKNTSKFPALTLLYGEASVQTAKDLLAGKKRFVDFPGFTPLGDDFNRCEMQQKLLAAYAKVQRMKMA